MRSTRLLALHMEVPEPPALSVVNKWALPEFDAHTARKGERSRERRDAGAVPRDGDPRPHGSGAKFDQDSLGRWTPADVFQGDVNIRTSARC